MRKPDLVLFTARFPYDGSESVLRAELSVVAPEFGRIFVLPSHVGSSVCELPANAELVELGWAHGWRRSDKLRALSSPWTLAVLERTAGNRSNFRPYLERSRSYLDILAMNLLKARSLREWIVSRRLSNALFYDYWFENSTLALAILRRAGVIGCAVSRAHRFDVFDTPEGLPKVPFREFKAAALDAIFAVADDGAAYLRQALGRNASKVEVSRLGVPLPVTYPTQRPEVPLIVSCSSLLPRKRVHLIPAALTGCERRLRWVHFGDGPERGRVEAAAAGLPATVSWELRGWVDNSTVRDFYTEEPVSAFLSLSESEGIPVSMMEAQSFGIPVVAAGVGGVPEIVSPETGILAPSTANPFEFAQALVEALAPSRFNADRIRTEFATRFSAESNYAAFAARLRSIWLKTQHDA